jgi:hypothetical protein
MLVRRLSSSALAEFLKKGPGASKRVIAEKQKRIQDRKNFKPKQFMRVNYNRLGEKAKNLPMTWEEVRPDTKGPYDYAGIGLEPEIFPLKPSESKFILHRYNLGEKLDLQDFKKMLATFHNHPFYEHFIGKNQVVIEIRVMRPLGYGGIREQSKLRSFFAVTSRGLFIPFSYRHCFGSKKRNFEKIFIETCKSVLEKNKVKKNINNIVHNLRAEEFAAGKVQESQGMSWRINWHKLCWDFSKENKIQWHNGGQLARLIYRNEFGYWNFNSQELNDRFLLFFQKAMLTNQYLELEMGNPNQYDGTFKYRGEDDAHMQSDEVSEGFDSSFEVEDDDEQVLKISEMVNSAENLKIRPITEQDL